jgi:hypothetical protein
MQPPYSSFHHLVNAIYGFWHGNQKLMAFYTGFFDESGHETGDLLCCGGLVLDGDEAMDFDRSWKDAIAPLPYLHTTDFIGGYKEFSDWRGRTDEKRALLTRAAGVIDQTSFQTFSSVLNMADYKKADQDISFSEFIAYPFSLCARFCSAQVNDWASRNWIKGPVRLVFEQRAEGTGEVVEVFERDKMPIPIFESKGTCPLQAADLIAWASYNKTLRSDNFVRYENALAALTACSSTHKYISYSKILEICENMRRITGIEIPNRSNLTVGVAFHTSKKRPRKKFPK